MDVPIIAAHVLLIRLSQNLSGMKARKIMSAILDAVEKLTSLRPAAHIIIRLSWYDVAILAVDYSEPVYRYKTLAEITLRNFFWLRDDESEVCHVMT
jgi:hypothetical protein